MEKHILMTEEELEEEVQKELEDGDFSEPDIEIINQKKASKLNRFKFSPNVPEADKRTYLEAFLITLGMYNYYFFSDEKNIDINLYINKVVSY